MSRKALTAALKASTKRNPPRRQEDGGESRERSVSSPSREEPTTLVAFRLPVSVDDQIEETVVRLKQAARAAGQSSLKKKELLELAIRHFLSLSPGEILDLRSKVS